MKHRTHTKEEVLVKRFSSSSLGKRLQHVRTRSFLLESPTKTTEIVVDRWVNTAASGWPLQNANPGPQKVVKWILLQQQQTRNAKTFRIWQSQRQFIDSRERGGHDIPQHHHLSQRDVNARCVRVRMCSWWKGGCKGGQQYHALRGICLETWIWLRTPLMSTPLTHAGLEDGDDCDDDLKNFVDKIHIGSKRRFHGLLRNGI